jgi:hypothetical protein
MRLSPHFTLDELLTTRQAAFAAAQRAHAERPEVLAALRELTNNLLEPIRARVGRPIRITSGVRCPPLNAATEGASPTSQHVPGQASDFQVPGLTDLELAGVWEWIGWESGLPFGQVIFEDKRPGVEGGAWIHISLGAPWRAASRCGQRLTWTPTQGYRTWTSPPLGVK